MFLNWMQGKLIISCLFEYRGKVLGGLREFTTAKPVDRIRYAKMEDVEMVVGVRLV